MEAKFKTEEGSVSSFWSIVENIFNDQAGQSLINLQGCADEYNSCQKPICYRSSDKIQEQYLKEKLHFTQKQKCGLSVETTRLTHSWNFSNAKSTALSQ